MEWFRFWPPGGVVAQSVLATFWPKRHFAEIFFSIFFGPNSSLGQGTTYNFFPEGCFLSNSFYSQKRNCYEGLFRINPCLPL